MKLLKSLMIVGSALGIYAAVKKYFRKPKLEKPEPDIPPHINKYEDMQPKEIKEQFKQRIAAGEWLTTEEYEDMMTILARTD